MRRNRVAECTHFVCGVELARVVLRCRAGVAGLASNRYLPRLQVWRSQPPKQMSPERFDRHHRFNRILSEPEKEEWRIADEPSREFEDPPTLRWGNARHGLLPRLYHQARHPVPRFVNRNSALASEPGSRCRQVDLGAGTARGRAPLAATQEPAPDLLLPKGQPKSPRL